MGETPLVLERVTKAFHDVVAVDDLSLVVRRGTVFGLLGPNGSGKTTTLRMTLGILVPDRGAVRLWGRSPREVVRERVGYLPEERGLYPKMRVLEHLVFLAELHGVPRSAARDRATHWLADHRAEGWARRRVEELSKGQQQTVQFIGALLHEPDLIIVDEPFAGLDPVNVESLQRTIRKLRDEGKTVLLSTHRMDQVERLCDEICLIHRGKAIFTGALRELRALHGRKAVHLVMDGSRILFEPDDLIADVEPADDGVRVRLREGADAQELLRRAQRMGKVMRFEVIEPPLEEIFVEMVKSR